MGVHDHIVSHSLVGQSTAYHGTPYTNTLVAVVAPTNKYEFTKRHEKEITHSNMTVCMSGSYLFPGLGLEKG